MDDFPSKRYSVIYADPPWFYNARNNPTETSFAYGASGHYDLMKTEEICKLPVNEIADINCALFMWATMPLLPDALQVIEAWGFRYITVGFTWVKTNKNETPWFGVGYYTKSNIELCLFALKGKMKPITNKISQVISEPRGEHSVKPPIIRHKIVRLFDDVPRIELFSRDRPKGWDVWGNEIPDVSDDIEYDLEEFF